MVDMNAMQSTVLHVQMYKEGNNQEMMMMMLLLLLIEQGQVE